MPCRCPGCLPQPASQPCRPPPPPPSACRAGEATWECGETDTACIQGNQTCPTTWAGTQTIMKVGWEAQHGAAWHSTAQHSTARREHSCQPLKRQELPGVTGPRCTPRFPPTPHAHPPARAPAGRPRRHSPSRRKLNEKRAAFPPLQGGCIGDNKGIEAGFTFSLGGAPPGAAGGAAARARRHQPPHAGRAAALCRLRGRSCVVNLGCSREGPGAAASARHGGGGGRSPCSRARRTGCSRGRAPAAGWGGPAGPLAGPLVEPQAGGRGRKLAAAGLFPLLPAPRSVAGGDVKGGGGGGIDAVELGGAAQRVGAHGGEQQPVAHLGREGAGGARRGGEE